MASEEIVNNLIKENRDAVHYTGKTVATPSRHDGGLSPVIGAHNIQIWRSEQGWLYNHQPMMAYWNGKFYIHYLTDPRSEHEPPGKTMLQTSTDGYTWSEQVELFPEYNVPDGFTKPNIPGVEAKNLKAIMHQRVGFFVSKSNKLIAIGNYGVALTPTDDPNDGNGIGRVVREIKADGSFGDIYFIYYNHGFSEKNTDFPNYKKSKDKEFVKACEELIADPMIRMQWAEEADRNDDILPLKTPYKAFCGYTLPDGRKVALWKHALTSMSSDGGNTWRTPVYRAHGFVNSNAKIWGQRLSDGTYATVYNPAEYRWPLAISLSADGLEYTTLNLVSGEVTPERHWGLYKSYGPQYTRGILEGNGTPPDNKLWVTYSMNKEDIWVASVPVPVKLTATEQADVSFDKYDKLADMTDWNIYSSLWAPVSLNGKWLVLSDKDPYDYARVEKVIPATKELTVDFDVKAAQNDHGQLNIEFLDDKGNMCTRIMIDSLSTIKVKGGARYGGLVKNYEPNKEYHITAKLSIDGHVGTYFVNGKKVTSRMFDTPLEAITRVVFRTGDVFEKPDFETPADQTEDMPRADEEDQMATFYIANFKTSSSDADATSSVLKYDDYAYHVNYFNEMEDENIVTDIPNSESSEWLSKNIPLFDCPDKDFEEMYYFRWWSLRKHIKRTPVGYGMTEFLVNRSYADKYNLIACAIGHHIMETRWLRDTTYIHQILNTWYYGNDGKAMKKMERFSSWNPAAVYEAYKVLGDTTYMLGLMPSLEEEYARWKGSNRLENGLYWQGDVQDGMEESISGGRKKQYARPTINSYMYGNARALSAMSTLAGDSNKAIKYDQDADELKSLIKTKLWNENHSFFETMRGDTLAAVREAIGFIPWYFNLPDDENKYDEAWKQINDEKGFSAPYGLTTAERRHPEFRSHGTGTCEWDGAIWPFATSQTLTAMANYLNDYPSPVLTDSTFFRQMKLYVESQHKRGRPYIGEYLDETNGAWLMGDQERSRYYNHSTFADLIITGIVGLRPQADGSIVINPLLPENTWDHFCLDNVNYRGNVITILYDKDGQNYHQGKGLILLVNGKEVASREDLGKLTYKGTSK
ncbi:MAG: six-hairpin glycosidase [Prevotella sp.]|nr:six-hairpin glycosidase [Prevotella sp.]